MMKFMRFGVLIFSSPGFVWFSVTRRSLISLVIVPKRIEPLPRSSIVHSSHVSFSRSQDREKKSDNLMGWKLPSRKAGSDGGSQHLWLVYPSSWRPEAIVMLPQNIQFSFLKLVNDREADCSFGLKISWLPDGAAQWRSDWLGIRECFLEVSFVSDNHSTVGFLTRSFLLVLIPCPHEHRPTTCE